MNTLHQQIDIEWPVVALFNYVSDITNSPEWRSEVIRAEWIDRKPGHVGSVYQEVKRIHEDEITLLFVVSEFVPYLKRAVILEGVVHYSIRFSALSEEWTRIDVTIDQPKGAGDHLYQLLVDDFSRLKNILEEVYC